MIRRSHDNGDKVHIITACTGTQTVFGFGSGTGFEPGDPIVKADQLIGVSQTKLGFSFFRLMNDRVHPNGRIIADLRVFCDQFTRHERDVIST